MVIGITSEAHSAIQGFVNSMGSKMDYVVAADTGNVARRKVMEVRAEQRAAYAEPNAWLSRY